MRIEEIEVVSLRFSYPAGGGFRYAGGVATGRLTTLVLVRDTAGRTGLGSAYTHPELARIVVAEQLAPYLRGLEVSDARLVRAELLRLTRWYGRAGAAVTAIGAVDTAIWDLLAQEAGQPLWRYLGGREPSVPAYASGLLWHDDLEALREETRRHLSSGYRRVKMRLGRCRDYDEAAFLAVSDAAAASQGQVIVDGSLRYGDEDAAWLAGLLAQRSAVWFEEPFEPDDLPAFVRLRRRARVPLAAGESETSPAGLAGLLRSGAVDVVQPDASRAGGITTVLEIAALAAEAGARVATHTWSDAVAVLANAHAVAAVPAGMTVEIDRTGNPFIDELLTEPLAVRDGRLRLPETPGLGARLDESVLARYRLPDGPVPDGNYSDMLFGARPAPAAPYAARWPHEPGVAAAGG